MISTDGRASFAAFIYDSISSSEDIGGVSISGFSSGDGRFTMSAIVEGATVFRIDGQSLDMSIAIRGTKLQLVKGTNYDLVGKHKGYDMIKISPIAHCVVWFYVPIQAVSWDPGMAN